MRRLSAGRPATAAALLLAFLLVGRRPARAASYPPHLHFRTIETGQVSVHFHQGLEGMARQAAALATEILAIHEARYGRAVGRVHLVIVDAEDEPNGFASPLPYPLVAIRAVSPDGTDDFGNLEGWLRLVLTHELAHVVHLEEARGLWGAGRALLGRAPYLFPNTLAMSWMIEGLATYEETELTAFGRGRNPDSQMVLRMAALEGRFPHDDQAIYALDEWPGGQTPYLFGESFLRYLTKEAGGDALPRMARQHAGQVPPFLDGRTVGKVTGTGLEPSWKAWREEETAVFGREAATRRGEGLTQSRAITRRGIRQIAPRFSPDGEWVAYVSRTLDRFPKLRLVRPDGSDDHALVDVNGGSGLSWSADGRRIVYAQSQVYHTFSVFRDLSVVDVGSGRVRRLTRGMRAYDPDVSPDGRRVVFARKMGDHSDLWTMPIEGGEASLLTSSLPGVEWSGPRFSPRGDGVVAARLLPGGWLDLVRVDVGTGEVRQLTHDRARDVEPAFTPDGSAVVFHSDRDGVSNVYRLDLAEGTLRRLTNVLGGASAPDVSPDGRWLAWSDYSSRGYDVRVAPLDAASAQPARPFVDERPAPRPDPPPIASPAHGYRPWTMLWPRFWSPWVQLGDSQDRIGVATGGSDALFRHVWGARALYGTESRRVDPSAFYLYDRFRTTFLVSGSDEVDPGSEGRTHTRRVNLQASLPLRRTIHSVQTLSVTYRREREDYTGPRETQRQNLGGIETAWSLASALQYPYSISPVDGARLRLAWLHEAEALGSDLSLDKLTADGRAYLRFLGPRNVLALRAQGGMTIGDPTFKRSFAVGGYPDASLFDIVRTNRAVLRGYPDNAFTGRKFVAANAEYRFPLVSPQRGWRSLPLFLRHVSGTVFFDAAHAWSGEFRVQDVKTAAGASLGVDSALAFAAPFTAELSVARGFGSRGDTKVYLRLGLAF
jgi:Tol biopolymer transport system component